MPKTYRLIGLGDPIVQLEDGDVLMDRATKAAFKSGEKAEVDFMADLTRLCRQHGLTLEIEVEYSHGERFEHIEISRISDGTEAYWAAEDGELSFCAHPRSSFASTTVLGKNPRMTEAQIREFNAVKERRDRESSLIWAHDRKCDELRSRLEKEAELAWREEISKQPKPRYKPLCRCGEKFASKKALEAHCSETGHEANRLGA